MGSAAREAGGYKVKEGAPKPPDEEVLRLNWFLCGLRRAVHPTPWPYFSHYTKLQSHGRAALPTLTARPRDLLAPSRPAMPRS